MKMKRECSGEDSILLYVNGQSSMFILTNDGLAHFEASIRNEYS
jgi:hypothetical protein